MATDLPPDPYEVLGINQEANLQEIRTAHRRLVLKCHPDKVPDPAAKAQAADEFHRVQQAYELLSNESQRERYHEKVKLAKLRAEVLRKSNSAKFASRKPQTEDGRARQYHYEVRTPSVRRYEEEDHYVSARMPRKPAERQPERKRNSKPLYGELSERDRERQKSRKSLAKQPVSEMQPESTKSNQIPPLERMRSRDQNSERFTLEPSSGLGTKYSSRDPTTPKLERIKVKQDLKDLSRRARKQAIERPLENNKNTIIGLKGSVNGIEVDALSDTGAQMNFMNNNYAKEIGIKPSYFERNLRPSFLMGHGRNIEAVGKVEVTWRFGGEVATYNVIFYILPDCIFNIMLGSMFLYATSTLTTNRRRLTRIPRPRAALHTRVVNLCGLPTRRLNGVLELEKCSALPDSGAEPNLISYAYAKKRGWLLDMYNGPDSCTLLQFADGSTERTDGRLKLQWSFEKGWEVSAGSLSSAVEFDVLRGCPFDIVLGQDFLEETDAFVKHMEAFEDVFGEHMAGLNLVIRLPESRIRNILHRRPDRTPNQEAINSADTNQSLINDELQRRAEADRRIRRVQGNADLRRTERAKEDERRARWDDEHGHLSQSSNGQGASQPRDSSVRGTNPQSSPQSSSSRAMASPQREARTSSAMQSGPATSAQNHAPSPSTSTGRGSSSSMNSSSASSSSRTSMSSNRSSNPKNRNSDRGSGPASRGIWTKTPPGEFSPPLTTKDSMELIRERYGI